jgi:threonine/homoserine/homoserine lactone efflux protein
MDWPSHHREVVSLQRNRTSILRQNPAARNCNFFEAICLKKCAFCAAGIFEFGSTFLLRSDYACYAYRMLEYLIAVLLIELTPGPNMTWLAVIGANRGRASAYAAVAGITLGLVIAAFIAGFGLSAMITRAPWLFNALRWAGTLYLLYLAVDEWRDADDAPNAEDASAMAYFNRGLVTNILNPKAYLFYAAILPHFIRPEADQTQQMITLMAISVTVATFIHFLIATASGGFALWLRNSPNVIVIRRALAVAIGLAGVWFFISTQATLPRP